MFKIAWYIVGIIMFLASLAPGESASKERALIAGLLCFILAEVGA